MIKEMLNLAGLTPEQSNIYASLLENGPQSATKLASNTGIARTYVYKICEDLEKMGLVAKDLSKKTVFRPMSPDILSSHLRERKAKLDQNILRFEDELFVLREKYQQIDTKPVISFYEGIEGVKKVYLDSFNSKTEILALVQTSDVDPELYKWLTNIDFRSKNKVYVRAIVSSGKNSGTYAGKNEEELRETKLIDSSKYPLKYEVNIYDNKISIIYNRKGERLLGIIIEQLMVYTTFKSWFELTWGIMG